MVVGSKNVKNNLDWRRQLKSTLIKWKNFTKFEAKRIMQSFDIKEGSGLEGLKKALKFRVYANINEQSFVDVNKNKFIFRMNNCRVQSARTAKKLPDFPCKGVGLVEYGIFA
eukprot:EC822038.1.p1 GENE.EC822038.1~~EC822038.1.p1  ORF type:complete len:112 (+),score=23.58 EC822038.1:46-381(+)